MNLAYERYLEGMEKVRLMSRAELIEQVKACTERVKCSCCDSNAVQYAYNGPNGQEGYFCEECDRKNADPTFRRTRVSLGDASTIGDRFSMLEDRETYGHLKIQWVEGYFCPLIAEAYERGLLGWLDELDF